MQRQVGSTTRAKLEPYVNPAGARTVAIPMAPNLTVPRGSFIGMITADEVGTLRGDGTAIDGSGIAQYIAVYDFKTDADGLVYYGSGDDIEMTGVAANPHQTAEVYYTGDFKLAHLAAIVNDEIAELGGIVKGVAGHAEEWVHLP